MTRFSVPPKPAAIREGESSRKFGILAPRPTAIPDRPEQRTQQASTWTATTSGETRNMKSLKRIKSVLGTTEPTAANKNLPHKMVSRLTGSSPKIQKRRPSRLIIGKMNRVVNVDRISPTTARLRKLIIVTQLT